MSCKILCSKPKKTLCSLVSEYHKDGEYYHTITHNASYIMSKGFVNVIDVRGDGNCLIYSILVYLRHTRDINVFMTTILPFCNEHITAQLISSPDTVLSDATSMKHIADQVRNYILLHWDYKGSSEYHMNNHAVDGLAREMTMRLLGVDELVCYSLCPDLGDPNVRVTKISPEKKDLRPDIDHKWTVNLLSPSGYTHYNALLR